MTEREAYVAFNLTENVGWVRLHKLMEETGGSAAAAWERYAADARPQGRAADWEGELHRAERTKSRIVTPADAEYPAALRELASPPLALYVVGDAAALSRPAVAVVGTRHPSVYGENMARRFAAGLARAGWCVVSGLAAGVDAAAHEGALAGGGTTVGVLGGALDKFFPPENAKLARRMAEHGGAVVSEFPFGRPPDRQTFPQRNRVVAALARGVLAVEAPRASGTLITCDWARKLGRPLMAVPANLDSKLSAGCWDLIRGGAGCVTCAEDVVARVSAPQAEPPKAAPNIGAADLRVRPPQTPAAAPPPETPLTLEEAAVLRHVVSGGVPVDRLIRLTKLSPGKVNSALMGLRLKGKARFLPGNRVGPA